MNLAGCYTALVTPFADGQVDYPALRDLVNAQVAGGVSGVLPMGTTGESPTLDMDEHKKVIETVVDVVDGRCLVIAGTGANSTSEALELTEHAKSVGADATLQVTPYYNKPTQEGLVQHYTAIAEGTDVPLVLYNVPPRTACDMQAETVARLSENPQIIGIKEACGDAERVAEIRALVPDDFIVLSGEDAQTLQMMDLGATGTISVTANVCPAQMAEFCGSFLQGDRDRAGQLDAQLQPIHEILFIEPSPTPTKWALAEMGTIGGGIRLPLLPLTEPHHAEMRRRLQAVGALS